MKRCCEGAEVGRPRQSGCPRGCLGRNEGDQRQVDEGSEAIARGYSTLFVPATSLVTQLARARTEGRLEEELLRFAKPKLLVVGAKRRRACRVAVASSYLPAK